MPVYLMKNKVKSFVSPRTIKVLNQVGKTSIPRDMKRKAQLPGKRISKTGKVYWETRKNRSDKALSNI